MKDAILLSWGRPTNISVYDSHLFFCKTLLNLFGQSEESVEIATFLASDRAVYITSSNYVVDDGASGW